MYPETDIPLLPITQERWEEVSGNLPLSTKSRMERLLGLDISSNQIEAILNAELDDLLFQGIEGPLGLPEKAWASALLEYGTEKPTALSAAVYLRENGKMTREGMAPLVSESPTLEVEETVEWMSQEAASRGFVPADISRIEGAVDEVISERIEFIEERGMGAVGPLMGMVMAKLGGSADGQAVSKVLRERIEELVD